MVEAQLLNRLIMWPADHYSPNFVNSIGPNYGNFDNGEESALYKEQMQVVGRTPPWKLPAQLDLVQKEDSFSQELKDALTIYVFARATTYRKLYQIRKYNQRKPCTKYALKMRSQALKPMYDTYVEPMLKERMDKLTFPQVTIILKSLADWGRCMAPGYYMWDEYNKLLDKGFESLQAEPDQWRAVELAYFCEGYAECRGNLPSDVEKLDLLYNHWLTVRDQASWKLNQNFLLSWHELKHYEIDRRKGYKKVAGSFV